MTAPESTQKCQPCETGPHTCRQPVDVVQDAMDAIHAVDCGTDCARRHGPEVWRYYKQVAEAVLSSCTRTPKG